MAIVRPRGLRPVQFHLPDRLCSHLQNVSRACIARTTIPYSEAGLGITSILLRHGIVSNVSLGGPVTPDPPGFHRLPPALRRIWVGLKYRNGNPVLRYMSLVSKASKRVHVTNEELGRVLLGQRAQNIPGVGLGEILIVRVPAPAAAGRTGRDTMMDGWEAWRAGLGGEIIVRVS